MKRAEAYLALKKGNKVTHKTFAKGEYLNYVKRSIVTEDGYQIEKRFWDDDIFADGFEIYEDN